MGDPYYGLVGEQMETMFPLITWLQIGAYDWIHLYEDEGCVERYVEAPYIVDSLYRMELEGIEYSYELMD